MRHRRGFVTGLVLLALLGALCQIAAQTHMVWTGDDVYSRQLAAGFGDSLIIAFVLAILVDPAVQHKFASEWGRDLYWAIFSPNAPAEFRDALQAIAAPQGYVSNCHYELTFERAAGDAGYLNLDWRISLWGQTLDRRGFRISDRVFVVARHDGSPSTYTLWSFQSKDSHRASFDEGELRSLGAMSFDESGRTILDQDKLPGVERVGFGQEYMSERHLLTSRFLADFLPLFQPRIVLRQTVIIKGPAVAELEFSVTQLGGTQAPLRKYKRADGQVELRCEINEVAFPGQASLLSWKPKAGSSALAST